jgi:hypothetical protein
MKTQVQFFKQSLLLVLFFGMGPAGFAQDNASTKKFHFEAQTSTDSKLTVENKYGSVTVKNWDQDKVVIDVVVTMDMRDKEKAEKFLSYINVNFSNEGNEIKAITEIDEKFSNPGNFFNMGEDKNFSIDYTVNMPTNLDFNLRNKYGNVAINDLSGQLDIAVKYGNLKANKLTRDDSKPLSQVVLAYSNGSIEETNWLKMDLKYSKIDINKAKALVVVSKYSEIKVNDASSLVCEAKYDEYTIGKLTNFVGNGGYTDFKFEQVNRKFDLTIKYGGCQVDFVPKNFESITLTGSYADLKMGIEPGASYELNGNASYADINYPEENSRLSRIDENTHLSLNGRVGPDTKTEARVSIQTNYGNVDLRK